MAQATSTHLPGLPPGSVRGTPVTDNQGRSHPTYIGVAADGTKHVYMSDGQKAVAIRTIEPTRNSSPSLSTSPQQQAGVSVVAAAVTAGALAYGGSKLANTSAASKVSGATLDAMSKLKTQIDGIQSQITNLPKSGRFNMVDASRLANLKDSLTQQYNALKTGAVNLVSSGSPAPIPERIGQIQTRLATINKEIDGIQFKPSGEPKDYNYFNLVKERSALQTQAGALERAGQIQSQLTKINSDISSIEFKPNGEPKDYNYFNLVKERSALQTDLQAEAKILGTPVKGGLINFGEFLGSSKSGSGAAGLGEKIGSKAAGLFSKLAGPAEELGLKLGPAIGLYGIIPTIAGLVGVDSRIVGITTVDGQSVPVWNLNGKLYPGSKWGRGVGSPLSSGDNFTNNKGQQTTVSQFLQGKPGLLPSTKPGSTFFMPGNSLALLEVKTAAQKQAEAAKAALAKDKAELAQALKDQLSSAFTPYERQQTEIRVQKLKAKVTTDTNDVTVTDKQLTAASASLSAAASQQSAPPAKPVQIQDGYHPIAGKPAPAVISGNVANSATLSTGAKLFYLKNGGIIEQKTDGGIYTVKKSNETITGGWTGAAISAAQKAGLDPGFAGTLPPGMKLPSTKNVDPGFASNLGGWGGAAEAAAKKAGLLPTAPAGPGYTVVRDLKTNPPPFGGQTVPPEYTRGARVVDSKQLSTGARLDITATGAVIQTQPGGGYYRVGWVDPKSGYNLNTLQKSATSPYGSGSPASSAGPPGVLAPVRQASPAGAGGVLAPVRQPAAGGLGDRGTNSGVLVPVIQPAAGGLGDRGTNSNSGVLVPVKAQGGGGISEKLTPEEASKAPNSYRGNVATQSYYKFQDQAGNYNTLTTLVNGRILQTKADGTSFVVWDPAKNPGKTWSGYEKFGINPNESTPGADAGTVSWTSASATRPGATATVVAPQNAGAAPTAGAGYGSTPGWRDPTKGWGTITNTSAAQQAGLNTSKILEQRPDGSSGRIIARLNDGTYVSYDPKSPGASIQSAGTWNKNLWPTPTTSAGDGAGGGKGPAVSASTMQQPPPPPIAIPDAYNNTVANVNGYNAAGEYVGGMDGTIPPGELLAGKL